MLVIIYVDKISVRFICMLENICENIGLPESWMVHEIYDVNVKLQGSKTIHVDV